MAKANLRIGLDVDGETRTLLEAVQKTSIHYCMAHDCVHNFMADKGIWHSAVTPMNQCRFRMVIVGENGECKSYEQKYCYE